MRFLRILVLLLLLATLAFAQASKESAPAPVNGVVQNMDQFQKAFGCKAGQPMVRQNACRVW